MWAQIKSLLKSTLGKLAILFASFPLWKIAYNTIDAWGNFQVITEYLPRIWQFLVSPVGNFVVMIIGLGLIGLQLRRQHKQIRTTGDTVKELERQQPDRIKGLEQERESVKNLTDRIAGLEQEKTVLESDRSERDIIKAELDAIKTRYGWLYEIADHDRASIKQLVRVAGIAYQPEFGKAYIDFIFSAFNMSLYDIIINNSINKGAIRFGEDFEKFYYPTRIESDRPIL